MMNSSDSDIPFINDKIQTEFNELFFSKHSENELDELGLEKSAELYWNELCTYAKSVNWKNYV